MLPIMLTKSDWHSSLKKKYIIIIIVSIKNNFLHFPFILIIIS